MGVFCGGLAQIFAGIMEYRNGNTFGATAFTLYGIFWLTFVFIKLNLGGMGSEGTILGAYLLVWGVLTLFLFIGTLPGRKALKFVFLTLTITFFILSAGDFTHIELLIQIGGTVGLICGLSAMYTAFAEVLAEQHGKELLPF